MLAWTTETPASAETIARTLMCFILVVETSVHLGNRKKRWRPITDFASGSGRKEQRGLSVSLRFPLRDSVEDAPLLVGDGVLPLLEGRVGGSDQRCGFGTALQPHERRAEHGLGMIAPPVGGGCLFINRGGSGTT